MICRKCAVNPATYHHTSSDLDGIKRELHLCPECARMAGFLERFTPSVSEFLKGLGAGPGDPGYTVRDAAPLPCGRCRKAHASIHLFESKDVTNANSISARNAEGPRLQLWTPRSPTFQANPARIRGPLAPNAGEFDSTSGKSASRSGAICSFRCSPSASSCAAAPGRPPDRGGHTARTGPAPPKLHRS